METADPNSECQNKGKKIWCTVTIKPLHLAQTTSILCLFVVVQRRKGEVREVSGFDEYSPQLTKQYIDSTRTSTLKGIFW